MGKSKDKQDLDILAGKHYSKSNALVNSKGRASLIAQKLFAVGIQQAVEEEKTGLLVTTLRGTDLRKIFNKKNGSFYEQIKEAVTPDENRQSLLDYRVVYTDDTTKKVEAINVVTDCTFEDGILVIRFNNKVNGQIHALKANYTVFSLAETMPLKHVYSFKIYEILKAEYDRQDYIAEKQNLKESANPTYIMEVDLVDLKLRLGIIDPSANSDIVKALKESTPNYEKIDEIAANQKDYQKYRDFASFRRAALDKSQKELKEKTSISFEYEPIKSGKGGKTSAIRFYIHKNIKADEIVDAPNEKSEILSDDDKLEVVFKIIALLGSEFGARDIRIIAEKSNYDLNKVTNAYKLMKESNSEIKNPTAWIIAAIVGEYEKPRSIKNKNNFNNFPQNSYDFDALEKLLVEN